MHLYLLGGATVEDTPIKLLTGCHRRVLSHLELLAGAAAALAGKDPHPDAFDALTRVQRYFATSGKIHTVDEEDSLFPRLQARSDPALDAIMAELADQHRQADPLHERLDQVLDRVLADRAASSADAEALRDLAEFFLELYPGHIRREDDDLFPRAAEVLAESDWAEIWREMRARRD
ncbi:MAG: hemerythrin domain-containing protein [Candidatus Sericytochromatia bacterium]|nr:hemerythrin domain-containing protein [Candidatus Tanganyikabacteria bacterium]